jgi:membrane-bound lytic murein transglycosylase B
VSVVTNCDERPGAQTVTLPNGDRAARAAEAAQVSAGARSEPGPQPPRRRTGGPLAVAARLLLVVALLAAAGWGLWWLAAVLPASNTAGLTHDDVPPAAVQRNAAVPAVPGALASGAAAPAGPGGGPSRAPGGRDAVTAWADRMAPEVGIPARALRAYAAADLAMRASAPRCQVTWATLAAIGRVESDHGRHGGTALGGDGRPGRAIIGVPLDGSAGVVLAADTDRGRLDGDTVHDRAVGPMQFIPTTWARWGGDGDGDGRADPQDIDDAALSAGRYLCAGGRDLATPRGWWAAVLSYNDSVDYARRVFGAADLYAHRSR